MACFKTQKDVQYYRAQGQTEDVRERRVSRVTLCWFCRKCDWINNTYCHSRLVNKFIFEWQGCINTLCLSIHEKILIGKSDIVKLLFCAVAQEIPRCVATRFSTCIQVTKYTNSGRKGALVLQHTDDLLHIHAKNPKSADDQYFHAEIHYKCFEAAVMFLFPAVMVFHKPNLGSEMVLSEGVIIYTTQQFRYLPRFHSYCLTFILILLWYKWPLLAYS